MLDIAQSAPEFVTTDAHDKEYRLSDYRGKWVVLFFYPQDMTPGCTAEACEFRDSYVGFTDAQAVVLGISNSSAEQHVQFSNKHELPFPLLLDLDRKIVDAYGVRNTRKFFGLQLDRPKRVTYLINPQGEIAYVWKSVIPVGHAQEVLRKIKELQTA